MLSLYNAFMKAIEKLFLWLLHTKLSHCLSEKNKILKFARGQENLIEKIRQETCSCDGEIVWIHASSFGEFQVIRPIISQFKDKGFTVLMTFFSPSGYEIMQNQMKQKAHLDYVYYLPWDTKSNAKTFLEAVNPQKAIFVISEYWLNYLEELKNRNIETYFISSVIHKDSYLLKWYCKPIRRVLKTVTCIMVTDEDSKSCLEKDGFKNVRVMGDPLFDNAINVAKMSYTNPVIERFCATSPNIFVVGSISERHDLELATSLANTHRDMKFIMVPHEICEENLNEIKFHLDGRTELYSDCTESTDFSHIQTLIIDFMGALAHIYRYGQFCYVGGGFTPYLHSVLEPVVYGIPISFGPKIHRKIAAQQMIRLGIGRKVSTKAEIGNWLVELKSNPKLRDETRRKASAYVSGHAGATQKIVSCIMDRNG